MSGSGLALRPSPFGLDPGKLSASGPTIRHDEVVESGEGPDGGSGERRGTRWGAAGHPVESVVARPVPHAHHTVVQLGGATVVRDALLLLDPVRVRARRRGVRGGGVQHVVDLLHNREG